MRIILWLTIVLCLLGLYRNYQLSKSCGSISKVQMFDRCLTQEEVNALVGEVSHD